MPVVCLVRKNVPWESEIDPDQVEKYRDNLVNNAARIYSRMQRKIKNKGDYIEKVATPSSAEIPNYINPAFVSKGERSAGNIIHLHAKNAAMSYKKFKKGLEYQFETVDGVVAKRFADAVTAKSANWTDKVEKKSMRFTGDKIRGRGVAPFAIYWLTGYRLAAGMLTEADELITGGPLNVVVAGQRNAFKTGVQQELIQGGLLIDASEYDAAEIAAQNDRINHLIQSHVDPLFGFMPFATGADSHCDYQLVDGLFRLEIKITKV
jgi:hypothetical protein